MVGAFTGPFDLGPDIRHIRLAENAITPPVTQGFSDDALCEPAQQGGPADTNIAAYIHYPVVVFSINFDRQSNCPFHLIRANLCYVSLTASQKGHNEWKYGHRNITNVTGRAIVNDVYSGLRLKGGK
jgi:hypothetical protein